MRFSFALFFGASLVLTAAVACTAFDAADEQPQPEPDADAGADARDANQGGDPDATGDATTCAHDCGGAACENGACVALPVVDDIDALFGIAADDNDVFYSRRVQGGSIVRLGPNGTASDYVAMLDRPTDVVLVGDRLYYAVEGGAVHYKDRASSTGDTLYLGSAAIRLSADRNGVAWLTASGVSWTNRELGGLSSEGFISGSIGERSALTVGDGKTWILGMSAGAHTLEVFGRPGPRTETIPLPATEVTAIDSGARGVFLAANTGVIVVSNGAGGTVVDTVVPPASLGGEPRGIDEHDGLLYVVTNKGDVWRLEPDGSGLALLARTPDCFGDRIAVSPSWVYWTCMGGSVNGGAIRKTPRR